MKLSKISLEDKIKLMKILDEKVEQSKEGTKQIDHTELTKLGEKASDLIVKIIYEKLPKQKMLTKYDKEFHEVIDKIEKICPLLSESYAQMYNYIQKGKISKNSTYVKRLNKDKPYS
jgi:hypothetical protein